jgi:hypothetical protein
MNYLLEPKDKGTISDLKYCSDGILKCRVENVMRV